MPTVPLIFSQLLFNSPPTLVLTCLWLKAITNAKIKSKSLRRAVGFFEIVPAMFRAKLDSARNNRWACASRVF